jgi:hypothetical protein
VCVCVVCFVCVVCCVCVCCVCVCVVCVCVCVLCVVCVVLWFSESLVHVLPENVETVRWCPILRESRVGDEYAQVPGVLVNHAPEMEIH